MDADSEIVQADARIRTLNRSGEFDEADRWHKSWWRASRSTAARHFVLAGTFDFQDREAEAVSPYQRAWELGLSGDDVPRFYVQYGSTLRNVGQLDESVRVLQEGRERFPEDAAIQRLSGAGALQRGPCG